MGLIDGQPDRNVVADVTLCISAHGENNRLKLAVVISSVVTLQRIPVKRRYVASSSIRNRVYVIGGYNGTARLSAVDCLDLSDSEALWQPVAPMHHRRGLAGACTYQGPRHNSIAVNCSAAD